MNFALFGRFFLEFAMMYPAEYLCLASLQEHLRAPRKTYAIGASAITLMGLAGAAVCCMLDIETNFLLIPLLIISFWRCAGAPTGKYRSARPCFCSPCRQ